MLREGQRKENRKEHIGSQDNKMLSTFCVRSARCNHNLDPFWTRKLSRGTIAGLMHIKYLWEYVTDPDLYLHFSSSESVLL